MFVKFDEKGKFDRMSYEEQEGYDSVSDDLYLDMLFLVKQNGKISVDTMAKMQAENTPQIFRLKSELEKIKEDIEQVLMFHMQRDDLPEKQARAAEIVNEIRILEGKEPREVKEEIL